MAAVLVVDDEIDARDALCTYLSRCGHSVESAGSGQAALTSILSKPPDVVVLDLLMPGMDGPSLMSVIRSYFRLKTIPVVVWTGAGDGAVVERARDLGAETVLKKPNASFPEIRAAVEQAAHHKPH